MPSSGGLTVGPRAPAGAPLLLQAMESSVRAAPRSQSGVGVIGLPWSCASSPK